MTFLLSIARQNDEWSSLKLLVKIQSLNDSLLNSLKKSSTVLLIPCSRDIVGDQPKLVIRLISNCFLGVPSGLELSHMISP